MNFQLCLILYLKLYLHNSLKRLDAEHAGSETMNDYLCLGDVNHIK